MNSPGTTVKPSPDFCFGRDDLILNIIQDAHAQGIVLLFGGRQAGKTTILLKIKQLMSGGKVNSSSLAKISLPVYVMLRELPNGNNASPHDFFHYLAKCAAKVCEETIEGFELGVLPSETRKGDALQLYKSDIQAICEKANQVDIDFLFLLDEAGRLTEKHFTAGFHDNLFVILYGSEADIYRTSIVMCAAQELYHLVDDFGTSPVGARASCKYMPIMPVVAIELMLQTLEPKLLPDQIHSKAALIAGISGGHAGLSAHLARKSVGLMLDESKIVDLARDFQSNHRNLFHIWYDRLTEPTRTLHDLLLPLGYMKLNDVYSFFRSLEESHNEEEKFRNFLKLSDRAMQELQFVGIAHQEGDAIKVLNKLYADTMLPGLSSIIQAETNFSAKGLSTSGLRDKIREKATMIMQEVSAINTIRIRKKKKHIFEPSNQSFGIYIDLSRLAYNRDEFTHVASAFYLLIYELTYGVDPVDSKSKSLGLLPRGFRREEKIVQYVGAIRHYYGKAHIVERGTWVSTTVPEGDVLKKYLGSEEPPRDEHFIALQIGIMDDLLVYLERLRKHVSK